MDHYRSRWSDVKPILWCGHSPFKITPSRWWTLRWHQWPACNDCIYDGELFNKFNGRPVISCCILVYFELNSYASIDSLRFSFDASYAGCRNRAFHTQLFSLCSAHFGVFLKISAWMVRCVGVREKKPNATDWWWLIRFASTSSRNIFYIKFHSSAHVVRTKQKLCGPMPQPSIQIVD